MKPKAVAMKDANRIGISRLIRDAEDVGVVVFQRNGVDVAMLMPITLRGLHNLKLLFESFTFDPAKLDAYPDMKLAFETMASGSFFPSMEEAISEQLVKKRVQVEKPKRARAARKPKAAETISSSTKTEGRLK